MNYIYDKYNNTKKQIEIIYSNDSERIVAMTTFFEPTLIPYNFNKNCPNTLFH